MLLPELFQVFKNQVLNNNYKAFVSNVSKNDDYWVATSPGWVLFCYNNSDAAQVKCKLGHSSSTGIIGA